MLCCGCRKENKNSTNQRILGEGAGMYATYPQPVQYYQPCGQPGTLRRVVQLGPMHGPMGGHSQHQLHPHATYATINRPRMPEMILQSDFRKVSGISSEMFRQIEAVEKEYDPQTASLIEAAERRGEMVIRILDPRVLGRAGAEAGRRYLSTSVDGQTVQFVEIIKSPGQTLGLYIREGDGIRTSEGVFISRIAPESPIYNSGVLKLMDEILAVNLVDVRRMSLDDVVIVMSIPRRLVLTIRSQLYRPGMTSASGTLRRQQQPYVDEYRPPVVIVKKELDQEDAYGADDLNSNRDSENGQLLHARLKGLPMSMPPVAVALEGEESLYEEAALYYNSQPPLRNALRPMSRARDDTYVQIYQKAADARLRPYGAVVTNQPQTLQRVYPRTIDNLADHSNQYSSGGYGPPDVPLTKRPPLPMSRSAMHRPASALGRQRFWDDLGTGSLRRNPQVLRTGSESGIPPTLSDDFLERYTRPSSRTSTRTTTPTGYGLASMQDIRQRRYDDLRASLSTQALAALRRRAAADGSVSDTEASAKPSYGLKSHHHRMGHGGDQGGKYGSHLSGRSSAMDSLRSNSLPRNRSSGLGDYRGYNKSHQGQQQSSSSSHHGGGHHPPKRSQSRNQNSNGLKFDHQKATLAYDDDSDGAVSAPELPDKPRRLMGRRGPSPGLSPSQGGYSANEYRQWLTRAPSTSAIYDTVRRAGRATSTLPSGLSNTSLSKIAHSAESLLDTIRLEHQKNLLVDLYANRAAAAVVAAGRSSPASSLALNRDVSSDSLAALKLSRHLHHQQQQQQQQQHQQHQQHQQQQHQQQHHRGERGQSTLMSQPLGLDHLRGAIPHPTPVKPSEDGRMHLLTLNPREFFKYRYEKPGPGQLSGQALQGTNNGSNKHQAIPTSDSTTTIGDPVGSSASGLGAPGSGLTINGTSSSTHPREGTGFSGILWVHLLAGRGLRATVSTTTTPAPSSSGNAAATVVATSAASVAEGPGMNRDLYCVIECDRVHRARTVVRSGESSFDWDEIFELDLVDCREVSFLLYTWDPQYRHKLCYKGIINLVSLSLADTPVHSLALKMEPRGTLYIKMRYKEPNATFQRPLPTPPVPSALFGVDVETVVNRENSGSSVPLIVKRCAEEVEKRGLELVGIYRLCGSAVRKKMLREAFEKNAWLVDLSGEHVPDINVISSLIKDYLRELPEPLFTKALFDMMVDGLSVCLPDDPAGNAKLMFSILECLPKICRCTVMFLMDHIKIISQHSERNKMTPQALAAIFGPIFTCHAESDNLHKSIEVFKFLIEIWPLRRGSVLSRNHSLEVSGNSVSHHANGGGQAPSSVPSSVAHSSASVVHSSAPQQQQHTSKVHFSDE